MSIPLPLGESFDLLQSWDSTFNFMRMAFHYDTKFTCPFLYKCTSIFHGCKNDNFQMKKIDIFLIFAQNIVHVRTASLSFTI